MNETTGVDSTASPATALTCDACEGPCYFETSIPSVVWNSVIRAQGLQEYLCLACIVRVFAHAGVSFTAELHGDGFNGTPIEVCVNSEVAQDAAKIQDENNDLRWKLREAEVALATVTKERDILRHGHQALIDERTSRIEAEALSHERVRVVEALLDQRTKERDEMLTFFKCASVADLKQGIRGLQERVKFTESFESLEKERDEAQRAVEQLAGDVRAVNAANVEVEAEIARLTALLAQREEQIATLREALTQAESILSDGDYGEDVQWREARDKVRASLIPPPPRVEGG